MEISTRRDAIRQAKVNWLRQYSHKSDTEPLGWKRDRTFSEVRAALNALDTETCTQADITAAIGVPSWAAHECDECKSDEEFLIFVGEAPDYEARWWTLCGKCLNKAVKLLKTAKQAG